MINGIWLSTVIAEVSAPLPVRPETIWQALLYTMMFGLIGILLTVLGFKVFDWITPRMHVETELATNHNIAVAIVIAAIILGTSIVIATAIHG